MIVIPFIYFLCVFAYIWSKHKTWNMDLAATTLLIIISFFAIIIDVKDLYDDYGINECNITLPTLFLFCFQWTMVLIPLHLISRVPLHEHPPIKKPMLYSFFILMTLSSFIMIIAKAPDIIEALVMDMAEVRGEHYKDLAAGGDDSANYFLLLPSIFISTPFPTLALFFWFYMKAFMKCPIYLRGGILVASIVQAIIAIIMAGRAAMIYWAFDFFLLYSYFYQYLSKGVKRVITLTVSIFGGLAGFLFLSITIARFDGMSVGRDPLESIYGYAGQHINNFCTMFVKGGDAPASFDRIFPLFSKMTGNTYDMAAHYEAITSHLSSNIIVNVFDTFGGELYLDLGWFGYIFFFLLLAAGIFYLKYYCQEMTFNKVFILVIAVAFFTRGLFAWPFTGHYTTMALAATIFCCYLFKYQFKI